MGKAGEDGVRDALLLLFLLPGLWDTDVRPCSGFGEGLPGLRSGLKGMKYEKEIRPWN
jgi:hypothetical protein